MDTKLFERLVESMTQMNEIVCWASRAMHQPTLKVGTVTNY
ncbi:MAG: hypothetical protein P4L65_02470 [Legionella sp.]|nr:hypothetical protein [Legionella sp.]